jgi:chondroitin sulfate proteoglycan 4
LSVGSGEDDEEAHFRDSSAASLEVTSFDQSVVNEGRLHYIQSVSNQSSDSFVFDVSNGIRGLHDLVFHLTIVPRTLYVETREIGVTEGKAATLMPSHLHVVTSYYEDKVEDYLIVDPPQFGKLVDSKGSVSFFSVDDLERKSIQVFRHNAESEFDVTPPTFETFF